MPRLHIRILCVAQDVHADKAVRDDVLVIADLFGEVIRVEKSRLFVEVVGVICGDAILRGIGVLGGEHCLVEELKFLPALADFPVYKVDLVDDVLPQRGVQLEYGLFQNFREEE